MKICLYNTYSRKKEIFKPQFKKTVKIYSCGPTVYDYDHLGHAWNYTMADLLIRTLQYNGYKIRYIINITDVGHLTSDNDSGEDKIEKSAQEKHQTAQAIVQYFTEIYLTNRRKLNLVEPFLYPKASEHIPDIINLIKKIEKKGMAYKINDGVYFEVSKFPKYGHLSGNTLAQLKAGARIEINPQKHHPADFALWKFTPEKVKRQMEWTSPWGKGFPGWHIECSAMSLKYLGPTLDIHTGGEDNIFPHHESEIAQSETATGKQFVRYWFHPRFLMVEGQKMSKSLHNFYTLKDIEQKGFSPLALRYLFLTGHYRSQFNFTWESLQSSQIALNNLYDFIEYLLIIIKASRKLKPSKINNQQIKLKIAKWDKKFQQAINNDIDTPKALSIVWQLINTFNKNPNHEEAEIAYQLLMKWDKVLGLNLTHIKLEKLPLNIQKLTKKREKLRAQKKWPAADKLRLEIERQGYLIKDTPFGSWVKLTNKINY
ncbi:MAG: cysteine--tRNA ligase [Candidatus Pacebacteria bacterium]|nr:cysteine--tRNA ligase [Candidatus Paceibacterota bacterium]